jgi:hypothetical protein
MVKKGDRLQMSRKEKRQKKKMYGERRRGG